MNRELFRAPWYKKKKILFIFPINCVMWRTVWALLCFSSAWNSPGFELLAWSMSQKKVFIASEFASTLFGPLNMRSSNVTEIAFLGKYKTLMHYKFILKTIIMDLICGWRCLVDNFSYKTLWIHYSWLGSFVS